MMLLLSKILITSAILLLVFAAIAIWLSEATILYFPNKRKILINTGIVLGLLGLLSYISVVFIVIWH